MAAKGPQRPSGEKGVDAAGRAAGVIEQSAFGRRFSPLLCDEEFASRHLGRGKVANDWCSLRSRTAYASGFVPSEASVPP